VIEIRYDPYGLAQSVDLDMALYGVEASAAEWCRQLAQDLAEANVRAVVQEAELYHLGEAYTVRGPLAADTAVAVRLVHERTNAATWHRFGHNWHLDDDGGALDYYATRGTIRE